MENQELAEILDKISSELKNSDIDFGVITECRICQLFLVVAEKESNNILEK